MHRIRNEKMPSSISNMFKIRINDRYDLRSNNNNYDLGKPETNFYEKSLWNDLSIAAKEKGISLNKFKRILDGT